MSINRTAHVVAPAPRVVNRGRDGKWARAASRSNRPVYNSARQLPLQHVELADDHSCAVPLTHAGRLGRRERLPRRRPRVLPSLGDFASRSSISDGEVLGTVAAQLPVDSRPADAIHLGLQVLAALAQPTISWCKRGHCGDWCSPIAARNRRCRAAVSASRGAVFARLEAPHSR